MDGIQHLTSIASLMEQSTTCIDNQSSHLTHLSRLLTLVLVGVFSHFIQSSKTWGQLPITGVTVSEPIRGR